MSKDNTSSDIESEPDVMTTNDAVGNGGEKLQPVGFWDARIAHVRREVMFKWLLTSKGLSFQQEPSTKVY